MKRRREKRKTFPKSNKKGKRREKEKKRIEERKNKEREKKENLIQISKKETHEHTFFNRPITCSLTRLPCSKVFAELIIYFERWK